MIKNAAESFTVPWVRLVRGHRGLDLLGVSRHELPIVVELAEADSLTHPTHMLLRAIARGAALKRGWPLLGRAEWADIVAVPVSTLPDLLPICDVVCAAPAEYWSRWTGQGPLSRAAASTWPVLSDLRRALPRSGFRPVFLRTEHQLQRWESWDQVTVEEQQLPGRRTEGTSLADSGLSG
jgi:hypothetical protein